MEQTVTRGEEEGDNGGMKGKSKNMYEWPMDMDNSVGIAEAGVGWMEEGEGENWGNWNRITIKKW